MKFLFITASLALATFSIKWDTVNVSPSARGEIDKDGNYWTGALTECDKQCTSAGGNICGTN